MVASFTETESGKKATNRPKLAAALKLAKKERATLVISTLDQLSRSVHFISGLIESIVPFTCADQPHTKDVQLHIYGAMTAEERRRIAERTKAAKKAEGVKLGSPKLSELNRDRKAQRAAYRAAIGSTVMELRSQGLTFDQLRDELKLKFLSRMRRSPSNTAASGTCGGS